MPYAEAYTQQHGFMHAGIISTALDSACGYAAFSLMPADAAVLTVEFKTNLLAPAERRAIPVSRACGETRAHAHCLRGAGPCVSPGAEKLIATMTGTLMAVFDRGIQQ